MIKRIFTCAFGVFLNVHAAQAVQVSLDNMPPLDLNDQVEFNIANSTIKFDVADPIICHQTGATAANIELEIIDPNGDGKFLPLLSNVSHSTVTNVAAAQVNGPNGVCVTSEGSTFGDLIFKTGFLPDDFRYESAETFVVKNQSIDYQILVTNNDAEILEFDLVEFVSANADRDLAYFESVDLWSCVNDGVLNVDCNETNTLNLLSNASVPTGQTLELAVSRTVAIDSQVGSTINVLTGMFIKNAADEIVDVKVINKELTVVDNNAPVINWVTGSAISFIEDEAASQTLSFDVNDLTGIELTVNMIENALVVDDRLEVSGVGFVEITEGQYRVSFDVVPKADQFTALGETADVSIIIEDDFGSFSNQLISEVEIFAVNDAPSFTVGCFNIIINPTPAAGMEQVECNDNTNNPNAPQTLWMYQDFIHTISPGQVGDSSEAGQAITFEFSQFTGNIVDSESVFITTSDGGGTILNNLLLSINEGAQGSGSFQIRAIDDGTPNGASNVCPAQLLTDHCNTSEFSQTVNVTILPPTYTVGGVINGLPSADTISVLLRDGSGANLGNVENITGQSVDGSLAINFTYSAALLDGQVYNVLVSDDLATVECVVTTGISGVINEANINDVVIDCAAP